MECERDAVEPVDTLPDDWCPRATVALDWTEMDGVFFLTSPGRKHALNPVGVFLMELANGRHSLPEIVAITQEAFRLDMPPWAEVRQFLARARDEGLVV